MPRDVDTPYLVAPGVLYKESESPGMDKHIIMSPEHPLRTEKGDIGWKGLAPPQYSKEGSITLPGKGGR